MEKELTPEQIEKIGTAEMNILGTWRNDEVGLTYQFLLKEGIGDEGIVKVDESGNAYTSEYKINYNEGIYILEADGRKFRIFLIDSENGILDIEDVMGRRLPFHRFNKHFA